MLNCSDKVAIILDSLYIIYKINILKDEGALTDLICSTKVNKCFKIT